MARKKTLKTNEGNSYEDIPPCIKHWEEADNVPLTQAQKDLVEHIEAGNQSKVLQWGELSNRGDSFHELPTYIKHWEEARPWGWELRILTEDGLHTFHLKWKNYKRPRELSAKA